MTDDDLLQTINDSTLNATRHQLETLTSILHQNGAVRYLHPHLPLHHALLDPAAFRHAVPLSTYDDYADAIIQMAETSLDHQQPILSVDPLLCFFYSSGTSSPRPKLIPYFDSKLSKAASFLAHQGSAAIVRRLFPPRPSVDKILWFLYGDNVTTTTKGGVKVMAASTYPLQGGSANWSQLKFIVSPREVILGSNVDHQMYCHLLCGIRNCDVLDAIRAPYAVGLIKAFSILEGKWEQMCRDLEEGFPSLEVSDSAMRKAVIEVLGGPQKKLAERVRVVFEGNNWGGIVRRLWPNVRYVRCVTTGSMEQYYRKLMYYAGEVPVLGGDYFASECCVGINLDIMQPPDRTRFVLLPTAAYFEFLPFDMDVDEATGRETVDISGVEVGRMYEVIVTTYRGFYRYLLGDVVRVVGFYNLSPLVEFVMRAPKGPGEIITERDLMSAMQSFQLVLDNAMATQITEFASFLDKEMSPKQLKVFIEAREGSRLVREESVVALRRCYSSLEDGLGGIYKVQRDRGEAGPLMLSVVKPGSFDRLSQVAIANGASAGQYKPPKIIRNPEIVHFLEGSTLVAIS